MAGDDPAGPARGGVAGTVCVAAAIDSQLAVGIRRAVSHRAPNRPEIVSPMNALPANLRRVLRPVRRGLRMSLNRLRRRLGLLGEDWQEALPAELQFWQRALSDPAKNWVLSEYQQRMDPNLELQEELKALVDAPPGATVRILDVGAGPLTSVGKKWSGRRVELYPIDPLAGEYGRLLQQLNLRPPVLTQVGHGERLREQFEENFFDLACASNSLDHSYDPLRAIEEMLRVVKPGASVYLWHFAQVGLREGYHGLHQWNFDIQNGELTLSDGRGRRHRLGDIFSGRAQVTCEWAEYTGCPVVIGTLRKHRPDPGVAANGGPGR
jgi:SAM-dependent methyltransferase